MQWSPTRSILALWTRGENSPSDVRLFNPRTLQFDHTKSVLNATSIEFSWSPCGSYLLALCHLTLKKGKSGTAILIFRCNEWGVPVDTIEINESVFACHWEGNSQRFALLMGDQARPSPVIYSLNPNKKTEIELRLPPRPCNSIVWSPHSDLLIISNLKNKSGVGGQIQGGTVEVYSMMLHTVIGQTQHPLANMIEWDPTGRFFSTCVTDNLDSNGFMIYNAKAEPLFESPLLQQLSRFSWRPNLPSLLTDDELYKLSIPQVFNLFKRKYARIDALSSTTAEEQRYVTFFSSNYF